MMMMIRLQQRPSTENLLLKEIDSASPYPPPPTTTTPPMINNNGANNSRRRRYVHVVYPGIGVTILLLLIGKCVIDGVNLQHSVCQKISGPFLINRSLSREGISLPVLDHRRNPSSPSYSSIDKYSQYDSRKFKILNFFHIIPIVGRTDECLVSQVSYNVSEIDVSIGFRITQIHSSAIACANAQQIGNPKYQM